MQGSGVGASEGAPEGLGLLRGPLQSRGCGMAGQSGPKSVRRELGGTCPFVLPRRPPERQAPLLPLGPRREWHFSLESPGGKKKIFMK